MPHVIPQKRDQLKVRISERAFRRIVAYAFRYANSSLNSKIWREVYGILIGALDKQKGGIVNVLDAIPMVVGERAGVNFEARQYVDMASIDASLFEKSTKRGLAQFLVGWWHTHPGFGFFFSQVDTMTHLGYQIANPNAMGLIFDHTQLTAFDCGLECLHLDDPTALMRAGHDFVIFELENYESLLQTTQAWAEKLQVKLKEAEKILTFIDGNLRRKLFAQLQRNFGILLVRKNISKEEKQEALGEDEETWVWDEKYLETLYRIPTFRRKLEHLLESANPKQKKAAAGKVSQFLQRPKQILADILNAFWKRLSTIASVYLYLDTRERQVIEVFDQRLIEYWRLLNTLLRKAGEILGEKLGYVTSRHQEHKPEIIESEVAKRNVAFPESNADVEKVTDPISPPGDSLPQSLPEKLVVKLPQSVIVPLKQYSEANAPNTSEIANEKIPIEEHLPNTPQDSVIESHTEPPHIDVWKRVVEIIRREKRVTVSKAAEILNVPSKVIWSFLVDLDVDGSLECDFDGELFTLMSDVSKFTSVMEEKFKNWEADRRNRN